MRSKPELSGREWYLNFDTTAVLTLRKKEHLKEAIPRMLKIHDYFPNEMQKIILENARAETRVRE